MNNSILINKKKDISILTLNRPDKLNSLNLEILESLEKIIKTIATDGKSKIIIITGSGNKSFSTGADLNYLKSLKNKKDAEAFVKRVHRIFNSIENMEQIVIAAINGYCLGGGCELAMACDIRIATPNAIFGQPEVKLGIIPGGGGTYRLQKIIGIAKAKELIFLGNYVDANNALKIGLINKIVSSDKLIYEAELFAKQIKINSYNAVKNAKHAINANSKYNEDIEKSDFVSSFNHPDRKEGIDAFIEKRKPNFK